jgi:hypothetical protein
MAIKVSIIIKLIQSKVVFKASTGGKQEENQELREAKICCAAFYLHLTILYYPPRSL